MYPLYMDLCHICGSRLTADILEKMIRQSVRTSALQRLRRLWSAMIMSSDENEDRSARMTDKRDDIPSEHPRQTAQNSPKAGEVLNMFKFLGRSLGVPPAKLQGFLLTLPSHVFSIFQQKVPKTVETLKMLNFCCAHP